MLPVHTVQYGGELHEETRRKHPDCAEWENRRRRRRRTTYGLLRRPREFSMSDSSSLEGMFSPTVIDSFWFISSLGGSSRLRSTDCGRPTDCRSNMSTSEPLLTSSDVRLKVDDASIDIFLVLLSRLSVCGYGHVEHARSTTSPPPPKSQMIQNVQVFGGAHSLKHLGCNALIVEWGLGIRV